MIGRRQGRRRRAKAYSGTRLRRVRGFKGGRGRATRKPMLWFDLLGSFLLRFAERHLAASFQ